MSDLSDSDNTSGVTGIQRGMMSETSVGMLKIIVSQNII